VLRVLLKCYSKKAARILMKRESLRTIEKRARETPDPVERLRYVRNQMISRTPDSVWWRPVRRIAAAIVVALAAVLLVWRIR
jgi:hypothetical protein